MTTSAKLVLISILIMSIIIPARAAVKTKDPRKGLKKALLHMTLFNLWYVLAVTYLYPRLL